MSGKDQMTIALVLSIRALKKARNRLKANTENSKQPKI
jgi:hypothetical protein